MEKKFIKIDPHIHSKGISTCSQITCEELIDKKLALGLDGAVLANHCQPWYYPESEHKSYVERVIEEFEKGKAYADKKGFRFFLGLEVSLDEPHYADWLLYGVTKEFLRASPCLYRLTQKELFTLCEEWGIVLVQAHPYRQTPCNPQYMHGVEINCSTGDLDKAPLVEAFAREHNLLITCGTDDHQITNKYVGGIFVPASCATSQDIASYLRGGRVTIFQNGVEKEYKTANYVGK